MAAVDTSIFIVKIVDFSISKAHNLFSSLFTPVKFKNL